MGETKRNDGGSAFPMPLLVLGNDDVDDDMAEALLKALAPRKVQGMSLHDWFAGQALAGLCAGDHHGSEGTTAKMRFHTYAAFADWAADAMIAARERVDASE